MRLGHTNSRMGKPAGNLTAAVPIVAQGEFFLGDDLLPFLTLAIGAALLFGTGAALIRPPAKRQDGALEKPPLGRSLLQMGIGLVATVWALATLLS